MTIQAEKLALEVWQLVAQREAAMAARMEQALDQHVHQVQALDLDDLGTLIPLCTPQAYLQSIQEHAQAVLSEELQRRAVLAHALSKAPPALDAPQPEVPEPLRTLLVSPLRAAREQIESSSKPIRDLHDFVKDPNSSNAVERRMASRVAGQAFGGLVGVAVAIAGNLFASAGKKKRMRAFASKIKQGPAAVRERWVAMHETHRDQARRVADHLYLQTLEPLLMAALAKGDRAALSAALRKAAA